jgi:poly(3-hydroxybutyrate) depolymerase
MRARQILMLSGALTGVIGLVAGGCSNGGPGGIMQLPTGAAGQGDTSGAAGSPSGAAGSDQSGTAGTPASGAAGEQSGAAGNPGSAGITAGAAGAGAAGATGAAGTGAAGATSGAAGTGAAGTGSSAQPMGMSNGCGKTVPALVTMGQWSVMASTESPTLKAEPPGGPPAMMVVGPDGKTWPRGFYMLVPTTYDKTKPSRVIFEGAGCDDYGTDAGGKQGYDYHTIAGIKSAAEQTIQVGIDYDPARTDFCYDDQNPMSNDFAFFPLLHKFVEDNFCVDLNHEFYSGYSSGGWLGNQFTCAFPDILRGVVEATGEEAAMQPTCVQGHPVAGMFLHEIDDPYNPYSGALPGCERLLKQNGCSTTTCVPSDTSLSTVYTPPKFSAGANPPPTMNCVSFKGCPATAPVVFCTTNGLVQGNNKDPGHYIGAGSWIPELFTDFILKF